VKTVLFVDDEILIQRAVQRVFAEEEDICLLIASDGDEALDIIRTKEVWVVVTDNQMPGLGGIELLERVRHISPATVRIMMTAHADLKTAIDAINRSEAFRFVTKPWDNDDLRSVVRQGVERYGLIKTLSRGEQGAIRSIAQTIELKDPYTRGHCDRVAEYASALARRYGIPEEGIVHITYGSWLHDCGKIGVPESVLNSPERLGQADLEIVCRHPLWGAEVARQAGLSPMVVNIILYHHEKYDGSGYPAGLKGEEIPIEARIVAIADVFDALYSDRPYRKAYAFDRVVEIMDEMTETSFDPRLMELFQPVAEEVRANA